MLGASLQTPQQNTVIETTADNVKHAEEEAQEPAKQANENDEEGVVGSPLKMLVESPAENVIIFSNSV